MVLFKVALVGHSLIPRHLYVDRCEIRIFRAPGARTHEFGRNDALRPALDWQHDLTILYLGGNDVTPTCRVKKIADNIEKLVKTFQERCESEVAIVLLEKRYVGYEELGIPVGVRLPRISESHYKTVASAINTRLKRRLRGHKFFHHGARPFTVRLQPDGVHFNSQAREMQRNLYCEYIAEKRDAFFRNLGLQ